MKPFLSILLSFIFVLPNLAQHEEDFASSFMEMNRDEAILECMTVGPSMMERILKIPTDSMECDSLLPLLEQIKSVRVVSSQTTEEQAILLFEKAEVLAQYHPLGYLRVGKDAHSALYQRRRGEYIVEIVLILQRIGNFSLIDLTGSMTDNVLMRLTQGEDAQE